MLPQQTALSAGGELNVRRSQLQITCMGVHAQLTRVQGRQVVARQVACKLANVQGAAQLPQAPVPSVPRAIGLAGAHSWALACQSDIHAVVAAGGIVVQAAVRQGSQRGVGAAHRAKQDGAAGGGRAES